MEEAENVFLPPQGYTVLAFLSSPSPTPVVSVGLDCHGHVIVTYVVFMGEYHDIESCLSLRRRLLSSMVR